MENQCGTPCEEQTTWENSWDRGRETNPGEVWSGGDWVSYPCAGGMGLRGLKGPLQTSPIPGGAGFAEAENRWSWA